MRTSWRERAALAGLFGAWACQVPEPAPSQPSAEEAPAAAEAAPAASATSCELEPTAPADDRGDTPPSQATPARDDGPKGLQSLSFRPDGREIAVVFGPDLVLVDPRSGAVREPLERSPRPTAVAYSRRGDRLAVATADGKLRIHRAHDLGVLSRADSDRDRQCVAFSDDGRKVATCAGEVLDAATGQTVARLPIEGAWRVAVTPDGRSLVTLGFGVHLWDIASGRRLIEYGPACQGVHFSPDGRWVSSSGDGHELYAWPMGGKGYGPLVKARDCNGHVNPGFSPDSRWLFAVGRGRYRAFETGTWRLAAFYDSPLRADGTPGAESIAAIADDGSRVVVVSEDERSAFVWDAVALHRVSELDAAGRSFHAFSPDGRTVAALVGDTLELVSAQTGVPALSLALAQPAPSPGREDER